MKDKSYKKRSFCALILTSFLLIACDKTDTASAKDISVTAQSRTVEKETDDATKFTADDEKTIPNTFLWKVEKSNQPTSYLLGTIHIGKSPQLPKHIKSAFGKTDALVTESLLDSPEEMQTAMQMFDFEGTALSEKIGQERFNRIINMPELKSQGLTPESLEMIKPWGIIMLLMYHQPDGYSAQMGMDMLLVNEANTQSKTKFGLEKSAEQIQLFINLPDEKMLSLLDNILNSNEKNKALSLKLAQAYEQNKANELYQIVTEEDANYEDFPENEKAFWKKWMEEDLLINRNQKWIPVMDGLMIKHASFVAVGSAHLYGKTGVINLLRDNGYTVTPVMPE